MTTVEVAEKKWQTFCELLQKFSQGVMVNIQVEQEGRVSVVAKDVPLLGVGLDDKSDPCNKHLIIEAGLPAEKHVRHVVMEPIHIRLKNGTAGPRYNRVHILAENGTTIIEFHPGLNPAILEALEA